jgi:hypothetical protein
LSAGGLVCVGDETPAANSVTIQPMIETGLVS